MRNDPLEEHKRKMAATLGALSKANQGDDSFSYAIQPDIANRQTIYRVEKGGVHASFAVPSRGAFDLDSALAAARAYIQGKLDGARYKVLETRERVLDLEDVESLEDLDSIPWDRKTGKHDKAARDWFKALGNSEVTVTGLLPKAKVEPAIVSHSWQEIVQRSMVTSIVPTQPITVDSADSSWTSGYTWGV